LHSKKYSKFRFEGKTGEERYLLVSSKDTFMITSMESSRRDMFIDMVLIGLSSKVTKLRSPSVSRSYPKQVWLYLKQGGSFYCVESENCVTWGKAIHDKTRIPEGAEMKAKKGKEINELVKHVISSDRPTDFLFISR